jgi:polysaccharide biosynthesis protein PslH
MRLLYLTPFVPYPPVTGSSMIALNHIEQLSLRHTVDLISFRNRENPEALGTLPRWCHDIQLVNRPPRWRSLLNTLTGVVRYIPIGVAAFGSEEMAALVSRRLAEVKYDAVIFQLAEMAQFQPDWFQGPSIWSLEDPPVLKYQRMLPLYPWYTKPLVWDRIARRQRYEKHRAGRFDCVVFVNEQDSRDYRNILPDADLDWVPSGIDVDAFRSAEEVARCRGMIVMTGNMFHRPNVDAVEYFCREVFPLICKRVQTATLWLVGARPVSAVRKWAKNSRIRITGFVPDISLYLSQAEVSVCPVRLRIGTQTKILEALACGTPVVTSSAGNHGIGAVSGEHLYVADDPADFADKVAGLLSGERWSELSQNGRRFVAQNFSWEKSTAKLEQVLGRFVGARTLDTVSL